MEASTIMKFDIEGSEVAALLGSIKTISEFLSKLAISVYDQGNYLPEPYSICASTFSNTTYYLRHCSEDTDETVLFNLPQI